VTANETAPAAAVGAAPHEGSSLLETDARIIAHADRNERSA
jgi:hypothetical protein